MTCAREMKWEYQKLRVDQSELMEELRVSGEEGWELVNFVMSPDGKECVCILKRPLASNRPEQKI